MDQQTDGACEARFPLPGFIVASAAEVRVDLAALDSPQLFADFIQSLFVSGNYLIELDHALFENLLYHWSMDDLARELDRRERQGQPPVIRLARAVARFLPERRVLYRGLRSDSGGQEAEYLFEPLFVERECAEGDGGALHTVSEPVQLDPDEFVAALWVAGIRQGLDMPAIRAAMQAGGTQWQRVASMQPPVSGQDATLVEQSSSLRRDNTPRIRPDGRLDLCQYANRFPQVHADDVLFRKLPMQEGRPGWDVRGRLLLPPPVKDFELRTLAGDGVRLEARDGQQCLIADQDGFVDIEPQSGRISVIDKIVNRDGVSSRTTGNLALSGDTYEEHGEVQEKRRIEGLHMTFMAPVYGQVISRGGRVQLHAGLSGGLVENPQGSVCIEGAASGARIDAHGGEVVLKRAESCIILAERVRAEHLVACTVIADRIEVDLLEGGVAACRQAGIERCRDRRGSPAVLRLRLPDPAPFLARLDALAQSLQEIDRGIAGRQDVLQELRQQRDMQTYFTLHARIKSGAQTLSPAQVSQWNALVARVAPNLRIAQKISGEIAALEQQRSECVRERDAVEASRQALVNATGCRIDAVLGETEVTSWHWPEAGKPLHRLGQKELLAAVSTVSPGDQAIFAGTEGSLCWP